MDVLDIQFPQPVIVPIVGEDLAVYPLRARQFGPFRRSAAALLAVYNDLATHKAETAPEQPWLAYLADLSPARWVELVCGHMDDVVAALAVAIERPPEWVGALFLHDILQLARTVVRVNLDFFLKLLLSLEAGATERTGPIISTPSSEPATPIPAI
jgi:hypothetical protein